MPISQFYPQVHPGQPHFLLLYHTTAIATLGADAFAQLMAYVTRVVSVRSKEARETLQASKAIVEEMRQVIEKKTFRYDKVQS